MRFILALFGTLLLGSMFAAPGMTGLASAASVTPGETISLVATAYGPSLKDNYPYGPVDYYGNPLKPGDVAVDPSVIPLGTRLYVTGYHSSLLPAGGFDAVAVDTGGAIKGDRIDLYINAPDSQVSTFGIQDVTVTVLGQNGPVKTGSAQGGQGSSSGSASGSSSSGTSVTSTGGATGSSGNQAAGGSSSVQTPKGSTTVVSPRHWRDRYGNGTWTKGHRIGWHWRWAAGLRTKAWNRGR